MSFSFVDLERKGELSVVEDCDLSYEDCIALARLSASAWAAADSSFTSWER